MENDFSSGPGHTKYLLCVKLLLAVKKGVTDPFLDKFWVRLYTCNLCKKMFVLQKKNCYP